MPGPRPGQMQNLRCVAYLGPGLGVEDDVGLGRELNEARPARLLGLDADAGCRELDAQVPDALEV